ncbi:MAG: hypothetical protein QW103_01315 [Candidatus Pacearchaeota archaeon]
MEKNLEEKCREIRDEEKKKSSVYEKRQEFNYFPYERIIEYKPTVRECGAVPCTYAG